jgi:exodeoxyribonuclease V alpha subunit
MAIKLKGRDANFQILSPKYDGVVGVHTLNDRLREALNPASAGKKELTIGTLKFREGDRVMVVKNDYDLAVYNGDMGKLMSIHSDRVVLRVHNAGEDGLDMVVEIPRKEVAQKLRLAYAITVHKCQGSEFDTVILPITRTQGRMLQRNLFYTAVTRARKRVWLLGDHLAVSKAIANDKVVQRSTGFERAITAALNSIRSTDKTAAGVESGDGGRQTQDAV